MSSVRIEELPLSLHVDVQDVNARVVHPPVVKLTLPGTTTTIIIIIIIILIIMERKNNKKRTHHAR